MSFFIAFRFGVDCKSAMKRHVQTIRGDVLCVADFRRKCRSVVTDRIRGRR